MGWFTKALTAMRHAGRAPFFLGFLARTRFDYAKEVGDGLDASVITAPVQWIQRAFPEARLRVVRRQGEEEEELEGHALLDLVERPNAFYDGEDLWVGTLFSYLVAGNGYWLKVRNGAGRVVELWYTPHWLMTPKWPDDGSEFISHYEYRPGGGTPPVRLEPEDVVHFRYGVDPRNPRLGISPLHGAIREIFMDLESSNFVAALLRNMGVPGLVLSPDGGAQASPEDVAAVKTWLRESFTGDKRGQPLVLGAAAKVHEYGFTPQQMDLSAVRDVAEERVCACLGIPAAVVGFGAGLQTAKVGATMEELRKLAWVNGIVPLQRKLAQTLERSLLPDFQADAKAGRESVEFDASEVLALEDDLLKRAQRWVEMVRGGVARVDEARDAMGLDVDDSHKIFLRAFSMIEVPEGAPPRPSATSPAGEEDEGEPSTRGLKQAPRRASRAQAERGAAYVRALQAMEEPLARAFQPRLTPFFETLGQAARSAATPLLEEEVLTLRQAQGQEKQDDLLIGRILEQLELPLHETTFRRLYEAHYLAVAEEVAKAGELVGLATDLPDPVARAVVAAGGRRSGLVDLSAQSRDALFDALAEGRAAGEGVEQLADRIEEHVSAGPWRSAEMRARTIARTETRFAANTSTIARSRHEGVQRFIVFDGRFGPPRSTPSHIARDGSIVTTDEAVQMAAAEHPNGTLSFSPFFEEE